MPDQFISSTGLYDVLIPKGTIVDLLGTPSGEGMELEVDVKAVTDWLGLAEATAGEVVQLPGRLIMYTLSNFSAHGAGPASSTATGVIIRTSQPIRVPAGTELSFVGTHQPAEPDMPPPEPPPPSPPPPPPPVTAEPWYKKGSTWAWIGGGVLLVGGVIWLATRKPSEPSDQ